MLVNTGQPGPLLFQFRCKTLRGWRGSTFLRCSHNVSIKKHVIKAAILLDSYQLSAFSQVVDFSIEFLFCIRHNVSQIMLYLIVS